MQQSYLEVVRQHICTSFSEQCRIATTGLIIGRLALAIIICALANQFTVFIIDHYSPIGLPEARIDVSEIYFSPGDGPMPVDQQSLGELQPLPKVWQEIGHPDSASTGTGWYTALIPLNVPPNRLWVIYFPNITSSSVVYLNHEVLGRGLRLNEKIGQMRQRPLYINIPNGMLRADENFLQIKVEAGHEFFGSVEPFYLGPEADFITVYSSHYFFKVTLVKIIGSLLFFTFLATNVIWLMRQDESLYGWFSLSCLLWSCVIFTDFANDNSSILGYLKVLFRYVSITMFSTLLLIVINRFLNKHPTKIEKTVFGVAIAICIILALVPIEFMHLLCNYLVGAFALSIITYCFIAVIYNISRSSSITAIFIAFAISVIFFFSLGDLREALSMSGSKYSGMTTHYAAPIFIFVLGFKLIRDFVLARGQAEELNRTLEKRIQDKTHELQLNFTEMQKLQKQQILIEERDRMVMEMHDGLGGQLVSAMSMLDYDKVDKTTVSDAIKAALGDLRLMIDALDPTSDDLAMVLGGFRHRLEQSLKHTNIKLNWQVNDVPSTESMTPHSSLQILRILQEAITNAIKYSECDEITVTTGVESDRVLVSVEDNGSGMKTPEANHRGLGLGNMKRRAADINAELAIVDTGNGLKISLLMPIDQ